ncbi:MAG TPA: hypothetical protein VGO40_14620 [Longimicrobium sp.]|jgi:hypothetical protein|nr:hypothetical protein [Longimicrobium sp.]
MNRISRFISGGLFAAVLVAGGLAFTARSGSAKPILGCSGNICCTFDDQTGAIIACVRVS